MGVVFSAEDARLGRKVALKSVKLYFTGLEERAEAQGRLVKEAQAMASLSHPNIVPIYDLVVEDDVLWLALELVDGIDLRAWVRQERPAWSERLRMIVAAGQGLAAAHQASVLHRDIKPTNIVVDRGVGTARLLDFGLARTAETEEGPAVWEPVSGLSSPTSFDDTKTGTVMGTPAYMAPELRNGAPATGLSDQYSFCVTAFEVLVGRRPGEPEEGDGPEIPDRVLATLRRGMSSDPSQRWPSMDRLVEALREPSRSRGSRRFAALLGVGGVLAVAAAAWPQDDSRCGPDGGVAEFWDGESRAAIRDRLGDDALIADDVVSVLDTHADAIVAAHRELCTADRAEDDVGFDLQMSCLRHARQALEARVQVLLDPVTSVDHARRVVTDLPSPDECREGEPDPTLPKSQAERRRLEALRGDTERITALEKAGRYTEVLRALERLEEQTRDIEHSLTRIRVFTALTVNRQHLAMYSEAVESGLQAFALANEAGAYADAANSALLLAYLYGMRLGQREEGLRWADVAVSLAERTEVTQTLRAETIFARGSILTGAQGREAEAIAEIERTVPMFDEIYEDSSSQRGAFYRLASRTNLGIEYRNQGRYDEAVALLEEAHAIALTHPSLVQSEAVEASLQLAQWRAETGQADEAIPVMEEGLARLREQQGPSAFTVLTIEAILIDLRQEHAGDEISTERLHEIHDALDAMPDRGGVYLLGVETILARAHRRAGEFEEALRWATSALRLAETFHGPESSMTLGPRVELADIQHAAGDHAEALRHLRGAIEIAQTTMVADSPKLEELYEKLPKWESLVPQGKVDRPR
jgi:tetratricopeptide (TPR) repeat protein